MLARRIRRPECCPLGGIRREEFDRSRPYVILTLISGLLSGSLTAVSIHATVGRLFHDHGPPVHPSASATAPGFWGDNLDAPVVPAKSRQIDVLTLEYLAELTLAILGASTLEKPECGICDRLARSARTSVARDERAEMACRSSRTRAD